jgi:ElaB/YqjD/DUF883 family membrane-anchored ribosome-binding protein
MESTSYGKTPSSGLSNNLDSTLNKASSSAHAAVDSMAGAADEAARKAKPKIDQVAAMAHKAVDKAADAAAPTAEWLVDKGDSLTATQRKLVADTCSYVSANPLKSVGFALLAGFLISKIVL